MSFNEIYLQISSAFTQNNLSVEKGYNHFISNASQEKICSIVESVGFCPVLPCDNVVFTVVPYCLPNHYLTDEEIHGLLNHSQFSSEVTDNSVEDRWKGTNDQRLPVLSSLNKGLLTVISRYVKGEYPPVEIGSSIGYDVSLKAIKTQPSTAECQLLKNVSHDPVYKLDIEGLYNSLKDSAKKVSLFFALNVFDTIPHDERPVCLQQLSQLQNRGDHILVMLDTNPHIQRVCEHLEFLHPGHVPLPFFALTGVYSKLSVIMVPMQYGYRKLSPTELHDTVSSELKTLTSRTISPLQLQLYELQSKHNLKVVILEDFFAAQMQKEFGQVGYTTNTYYHISFTAEGLSTDPKELTYKPVTDVAPIRKTSLSDKNLQAWLTEKGIGIPTHLKKGQRILGAELLVIEATKL